MSFEQCKKQLKTLFEEHKFDWLLFSNQQNAVCVDVAHLPEFSRLSVAFPGYKAAFRKNRTVYDFRVDLTKMGVTTALSHTNLITDIYSKIVNGGMDASELRRQLILLAAQGNFDVETLKEKLPFQSIFPPTALLKRISEASGAKKFNWLGNYFDLTLEELFTSIKWIVLQEDINYPIEKNFEGRRMPFARYMETIFITQNNSHTLEEVIQRTLAHKRPKPWKEMDYGFLKLIN